MFVKWSKRSRNDPGSGPWTLHTAVLVESVRIKGQPRQRTIGYLASLRERPRERDREHVLFDPVADEVRERISFWSDALKRLDSLGITGSGRAKAVSDLGRRLTLPSRNEIEIAVAHQRKLVEYFGTWFDDADTYRQKTESTLQPIWNNTINEP